MTPRRDRPGNHVGGYPVVDLAEYDIDLGAVVLVPETWARRAALLPIAFDGDRLVVATADPTNVIALDDIRTITGRELLVVKVEEDALREAWAHLQAVEIADDDADESEEEERIAQEQAQRALAGSANDAPIVRAINQVISKAVQLHASDVHIEPQREDIRIRFRLDGSLTEVMRLPKRMQSGLASRLKIMAELDIAERRRAQDGRMTMNVNGEDVDLRITTIPAVRGEEAILRILDQSSGLQSLSDLGFLPAPLASYTRAIRKPFGAAIVVGPTGSGKTTTLYSSLAEVNDIDRKIITVEDPVEYELDGISQIRVDRKSGMTFATALRSILRSDPDVVMVGEIRDAETAKIAIQAAMTGHRVFSTLHTQDAPSAITRLIDMGVEPFLLASAVQCVLAQRLARKLCSHCKEPYVPTSDMIREYGLGDERLTLYRATGCGRCSGTGYRGRLALIELLVIDDDLERMIFQGAGTDEIRIAAMQRGMMSLRSDGFLKVKLGTTSLEEVLSVLDGTEAPEDVQRLPGLSLVPTESQATGGLFSCLAPNRNAI